MEKQKFIEIIEPLTNINSEKLFPVYSGGRRITYKPILSTSFSNTSATFSAPPPSPDIIVDRNVKLRVPVNITFTGSNVNAGYKLLQSNFDAFRAYPLNSVINTIDLTINDSSSSINVSDVIQALLRYNICQKLGQGKMTGSPSLLDQAQSYDQLVNTVRNPLGFYHNSNFGSYEGRGSFPIEIVSNTETGAEINAVLTEDIFLSPLMYGEDKENQGFIGVQTFQMVVNWGDKLSRMWSHSDAGGSTITNIEVKLGQPSLLFKYITPSLLKPIPTIRSYTFYDIQRYPTDSLASVNAGQSVELSSQNIQLNSIPLRMYVFARKKNSDLTFLDTDSFFSIDKITIQWENDSGLLSSASKQDLYRLSVNNGCNLTWPQWSGETMPYTLADSTQNINGPCGPLCLQFGKDIGLTGKSAGSLGTYQLQLDVVCTNHSQETITPTLYIVIVNLGTFVIQNNSSYKYIGMPNTKEVLDAKPASSIDYYNYETLAGSSFVGGFKFGKLKDFLHKGADYARKKIMPVFQDVAKVVKPLRLPYRLGKTLLDIGEKFGIGYAELEEICEDAGGDEDLAEKMIMGGYRKKKIVKRRVKKGGKKLSREQMRSVLNSIGV
jgi:hypothetical protein